MSIRDKRLQSDYLKMCDTFPNTEKSKIKIISTSGNPPDKYQIEFSVNSLVMNPKGQVVAKNSHTAEIYLTATYPRQAPQCRMLTPVFHPNIAPHAICIGDHWAVGESLPHLVIRIAEMLAYQSYNLKSPLNGDAAQWADKNRLKFPTDRTDFSSFFENSSSNISDSEIKAITDDSIVKCANCGDSVKGSELIICSSHHPVCSNCAFTCNECGKVICLKCITGKCSICNQIVCAHCITKCELCKTDVCLSHTKTCYICQKKVCDDCAITCSKCGKVVCLDHMKRLPGTNNYTCTNCQE